MKFFKEHILSAKKFDREAVLELFDEAKKMEEVFDKGKASFLEGKIMATLFFEPSTRTRFSFETAMQRLAGGVVSNPDMKVTSSSQKMETLEDTAKTVSQMVDVMVVRHPDPHSVGRMAAFSDCPMINAGDGINEHPTQALLDLYTIWKERGEIDGLKIALVGDLKNGRVPHSQIELLKLFDVNIWLVSPEGLKIPEELKQGINNLNELENLEDVIGDMDVIEMTRVQKERFVNEKEYEKYAGSYALNSKLIEKMGKKALVLHPLPRVEEISRDIDNDHRAMYFKQVRNGVVLRMALLKKVLTEQNE